MPLLKDPATIKFVAKKFILATNDPKNPISVIRQIHANDTGKIQIFLTNGNSYQDDIDTLSDLISITSNKAFLVHVEFDSSLALSHSPEIDKYLKTEIVDALSRYCDIEVGINDKYYYEPNKMIPRRVVAKSVSTNLKGLGKWDSYSSNQGYYLSGKTAFKFYVICPENDIAEIEESLGEILISRFRNALRNSKISSFSGRNHVSTDHEEVDVEEALSCSDDFLCTIGIEHDKTKVLTSMLNGELDEDVFAQNLRPIIKIVEKTLRTTR